jgi:hypothetical protein
MSLAAVGQFEKAVEVQRFMVTELERARQAELAGQLRANLDLYEHNRPCLTPWRDDDPIFTPIPAHLSDMTDLTGSASALHANNGSDRKP